uniref:Uncharacterized protein n=1 Tax=Tanacetum cinerariifolium TaxID=118510 RepID=A0A699JAX3_TANCI|nr:hypothetical protein [Tanacetum cinerariifolium]
MEIDSLKRRVKKLEKKQGSRTHKLKRLYKVGLSARVDSFEDEQSLGEDASKQGRIIIDIDVDEGITLVDETEENQGRINDQEDTETLFDVIDDLRDEITLAQALEALKTLKPKIRGIVISNPEEPKESSKKAKAEVIEGILKRADIELEQESSKKQKIDDDKETAKLKQLVKIIPDEEGVAIDVIPLAIKPPSIVDWKIHKEGKKSYYQIIRADRSLKKYLVFSHMLQDFAREDVETLWKW